MFLEIGSLIINSFFLYGCNANVYEKQFDKKLLIKGKIVGEGERFLRKKLESLMSLKFLMPIIKSKKEKISLPNRKKSRRKKSKHTKPNYKPS